MARLRWTGRGMFHDPSRGFRTTDGGHEFDDPDRVDEYLSHRSGDWELVEDEDEHEDEILDRAEAPFDPAEYTIAELKDEVAEISNNAKLAALYSAEVEGEDRVGAKHAIDDRLDDLEG